jgi:LPXTG-motif cell wall-anchored protein
MTPRQKESSGLMRKFFYLLLGLAGMGVGVWIFGRRRKRSKGGDAS